MSTFRLAAGGHYHRIPPISGWPWLGAQSIARDVTFEPSCQYDSADYNSQDVNKLFGLSFGLRGVHWNSARFGWRWSKSDNCIELLAYVYDHGVKNWDGQMRFPVVTQIQPGQRVRCVVRVPSAGYYSFEVFDAQGRSIQRIGLLPAPMALPSYGLTHGLYFGGALPCPHAMAVTIDRV